MDKHTADYWRDPMPEAMARRVLGSGHFDWVVEQGAAHCASRAAGAWQANSQESYGAYQTAKRVAEARLVERTKYATTVLRAFDDIQHAAQRDQRDVAAEVRRKARNAL